MNARMTSDFSYDPVTALDEASATGATAQIFADIRETMGLPLLTSIWRALADMQDSLEPVWTLTKPLYASGLVEPALERVIARAQLPTPHPLAPTQLRCVGLDAIDVHDIRAILAAYNRSNGMNLIAIAGLLMVADTDPPPPRIATASPTWPPLRALPSRAAIADDVWDLIRHVNALGASGVDAHVATLWRHLAHWPGLLALVHSAFAPLQADGAIASASARVVALALQEGARLAPLRPAQFELPDRARSTLTDYVREPTHVARMVVIGSMLAGWLGDLQPALMRLDQG